MKKGILFDLDGTLWDSAAEVTIAFNRALQELDGLDITLTAADFERTMGMPMDKLGQALFPQIPKERIPAVLDHCCAVENAYLREHGGKLYPDLEATLQALSQAYSLYIVSNCQLGYIDAFLDHYGFHSYFADFACYGDNERPKGENIAAVVKRNMLDKAIYVGDTQGDCDASYFAGLPFVFAAYGFGEVNKKDAVIDRLPELAATAEKLL